MSNRDAEAKCGAKYAAESQSQIPEVGSFSCVALRFPCS
jgi:hypothetical protein